MNIILVVFDSLRKDCIGVYGKPLWGEVKTPNLDRFASESLLFTNAYPESLPTLPSRRAIYTGKRVFPFHNANFRLKGDFVSTAGWGPIPEQDDTLSEILSANGYRTGLISSLYHQFKPSKNYWRGFDQWTFVRGKEWDPYKSGPEPSEEEINYYLPEEIGIPGRVEFIKKVIRNIRSLKNEEDYPVAQVMSKSVKWLEENRDAEKFFLMIESFDPHEPWNVPPNYREMYDTSTKREQIISGYFSADNLPGDLLKRTQANYSGLVTMCDRWFGHLYESMGKMGLLDNTAIVVTSDHGHSMGDKNFVGKTGYPSAPNVYDIPLLIRHPSGFGTGKTSGLMVQHHDLFPLLLGFSGAEYDLKAKGIEGRDFWGNVLNNDTSFRDHATVGWGPCITVIDENWWFNCLANGKGPLLYNRKKDAGMEKNVAAENRDVVDRLFSIALKDAKDGIPGYLKEQADRAEIIPGCSPIAAKASQI
ncbi:MAG: sulfatase [Candidatus Omnitrophica bacterium]|nr:sulfatase [Candidatus Omnitrophota bacterium]